MAQSWSWGSQIADKKYCCHVYSGATSCCLDMSDKLQKQISTIAGPSLAAFLEPLTHCGNVASLSLMYHFGRSSYELPELVPLPHFCGRSTCHSNWLHNFSVISPRSYKDVYVYNLFPHIAILRNSLPSECFSFDY